MAQKIDPEEEEENWGTKKHQLYGEGSERFWRSGDRKSAMSR